MTLEGMSLPRSHPVLNVSAQKPLAGTGAHGNIAFQVQAVLTPQTVAKLSSQIQSYITKITVKEGSSFKKGDLLISFNCTLQRAEAAKARAQLKSARATYNANQRLRTLGGLGLTELRESEAKYEETLAELDIKKHFLKHCNIRAPFNGKVVKLDVNQHETIKEGEVLIEILDNSDLRVEFIIPSSWLSWLRVDTPFRLFITETGKGYQGKVTTILHRIDAVSQSVKVLGELNKVESELISGMSGQASFIRKTPSR